MLSHVDASKGNNSTESLASNEVKGPKLASKRVSPAAYLLSQLRLRHLGMAFAWACTMLTMRTSTLLPEGSDPQVMSTALLVFSFGVSILTMVLLAINEYRKPGSFAELPDWLFVSGAIVGILAMKSPAYGIVDEPTAFFIGCFMTGISYGYLWVAWARVYGRLHPDVTTVALPLTFVLTVGLYFFVGLLDKVTILPDFAYMAFLPAISWVLLLRCQSQDECREMVDHREGLSVAVHKMADILVASALFSFLFGYLWESSLIALASVEETHRVPLAISAVVGFLLFLFTILARKRIDVDLLYKVAAPVIVLSCALFPLFFVEGPLVVGSVMDSGFTILEILVWIMVVTVSYDERVSGVIIGAIARSVFLLFRLAGVTIAYFVNELSISFGLSSSMFSAMAVGAIIVWGLMSNKGAREAEDRHSKAAIAREKYAEVLAASADARQAESGTRATKGPELQVVPQVGGSAKDGVAPGGVQLSSTFVWRASEAVSEKFGLSRREAELLPYLVLGRSASFIANEFYISENTVRTHIKHILEKTGATSKRGITDFVYVEGMKVLSERHEHQ